MKLPLVALVVVSGASAAYLIYLGVKSLDIVVSLYTYIHWVMAYFLHPLPKPLSRIYTAIGIALLAAFSYFLALRILPLL
jgi:hypothetical protein|nr:MAG: hypothetical protein TU35_07725 [Thermoproteus sp. AZ2]